MKLDYVAKDLYVDWERVEAAAQSLKGVVLFMHSGNPLAVEGALLEDLFTEVAPNPRRKKTALR